MGHGWEDLGEQNQAALTESGTLLRPSMNGHHTPTRWVQLYRLEN